MAVILISLSISSSAPLGSKSMIRGAARAIKNIAPRISAFIVVFCLTFLIHKLRKFYYDLRIRYQAIDFLICLISFFLIIRLLKQDYSVFLLTILVPQPKIINYSVGWHQK
jgi:hypothetical protein